MLVLRVSDFHVGAQAELIAAPKYNPACVAGFSFLIGVEIRAGLAPPERAQVRARVMGSEQTTLRKVGRSRDLGSREPGVCRRANPLPGAGAGEAEPLK